MKIQVRNEVPVSDSYRAERTRSLFNVDAADGASFQLDVDLPLETEDWQVGVVVGSSGSGKSSIGRHIAESDGWRWWNGAVWGEKPIIEELLPDGSFDKVTATLSSVGLGAVPAWLRPYHVLSNGEKFRADCAALLLNKVPAAVVDEFTSVLDRQVATIGSQALVKAWRKQPGRRLVLLSCHHDILPWVAPDWVYDTDQARLYLQGLEEVGEIDEQVRNYPEVGRLVIKR